MPPASTSILTPFGERPAENVHTVLPGAEIVHVDGGIQFTDASGNSRFLKHDGRPVRIPIEEANKGGVVPTAGPNPDWIAYAYWQNNSATPISSFSATWTVPPKPVTYSGQTLFLFISLEPKNHSAILLPALQYGYSAAGGGAKWTVASWYHVGSDVIHTPLVDVSPGKELIGSITLKGKNAKGLFNYTCSFSNVGRTTLDVTGAEQLSYATETLEAFNVKEATDYPEGSTVFYPIIIRTGTVPNVKWTAVSSEVTATVVVDGATDAEVVFAYPT